MFESFEDFNAVRDAAAEMENLNDVVGETKISGFEQFAEVNNEFITDYLKDNIPTEHLKNCPEIRYAPDNELFKAQPDYEGIFDTGTRSIQISDLASSTMVSELLHTVAHEVGHNAFEQLQELDPQSASRWEEIYRESLLQPNGLGFVSDYASTDAHEDFAESYHSYINDPELLKFMSPGKYEFMKNLVFNGREYGSLQTSDGVHMVMNKDVADTINGAMDGSDAKGEDIIGIGDGAQSVTDTYRCFNMVT